MNPSGLLPCPVCATTPKPQILGRILPNGDLLVLRFHSGTTILRGEHMSLGCGCGFMYFINGTIIEGTARLNVAV